MAKTIAYIRTSRNMLEVDDFIQMRISSRKTSKERRIDQMLLTLEGADTLIITELSCLGRSTAEVIGLVNELKIAIIFGYSNHIGLTTYVSKRKLRDVRNLVNAS